MKQDNVLAIPTPEHLDPLTAWLRAGARKRLAQAVDAELETFLEAYEALKDALGRRAVVRTGDVPARPVMTGRGDVNVHVPKTRDRSGAGLPGRSRLIPPDLKRTQSVETLLPVFYLKGLSTGDCPEALGALLGEEAAGLSPAPMSRLTTTWKSEYEAWQRRDVSTSRSVYVWADGMYCNGRGENDQQGILVLLGATAHGVQACIAISDGYRASAPSWREGLVSLQHRGVYTAPKLAIGEGAVGVWQALRQEYPQTRHQRWWVPTTRNGRAKVPKSLQAQVTAAVPEMWRSPTRQLAQTALEALRRMDGATYPQAVESVEREWDALCTLYDLPAEHWQHLRTTHPIESPCATGRLRTAKTRGGGSRTTIFSRVCTLGQSAAKGGRRLRGYRRLSAVLRGVTFIDGVEEAEVNKGRKVA